MNEREFYQRVLGLSAEWQVADVALQVEQERVELLVRCRVSQLPCPKCGQACTFHDLAPERTWRHLDTCQLRTYLRAAVPRVRCREHGVLTAAVPWAEPHGRFTVLFETFALRLLKACLNQSQAAALLKVSFDELHLLMQRAVERGLQRRDRTRLITDLAIDEKSLHRGHRYVTVLCDREAGYVIDVSEERKHRSARALLTLALTPAQRAQVTSITMDMWEPYMTAAAKCLPIARVIHDKFHVIKYLNEAVDRTRRREQRVLKAAGNDALSRTKYLFLKAFKRLTGSDLERFEAALAGSRQTAEAWRFKEVFQDFFRFDSVTAAERFLNAWCERARQSGIAAVVKVAELLARHAAGLLAYIRHPVTNALAETVNGKLQLLKAVGRGYRRFGNFRTVVLFHCGALDLNPLKSQ